MHVQWAAKISPHSSKMTHGNKKLADILCECFTYKNIIFIITFPIITNLHLSALL